MIIIKNNTAKLNDIVFENRNKNYGAYAIRSNYDNTLLKSLGITSLIFVSISVIAMLLNNTVAIEKKIDIGPNIVPPTITYSVPIDVTPLTKPKTDSPQQSSASASKTTAVSTVIKDVITEQKKEAVQTLDNPNNTEGKKANPDATTGIGKDPKAPDTGNEPTEGLGKTGAVDMAPDVLPKFDGIGPFLQKNLKYPGFAVEANVSGKVIVNFVIDEEGKIISATILKGVGYGCDEEALRVIKLMPKWTPGLKNGKPVKVSFSQAIVFRLQ